MTWLFGIVGAVVGFFIWTIITNLVGERNEAAAATINIGSVGLIFFVVFGFGIGATLSQYFQ